MRASPPPLTPLAAVAHIVAGVACAVALILGLAPALKVVMQ